MLNVYPLPYGRGSVGDSTTSARSRERKGADRRSTSASRSLMSVRVSLFVTCIVDQVFPNVGMAMADVLERAGCEVEFRESQTCCAQPAFNSGYRDQAREVAEHFLKTFEGVEYIVVPSGSCCSMISHHYAELFPGDKRVHDLEPRVFEFSQFLINVLKVEDLGASFDGLVTYHDSCHALR